MAKNPWDRLNEEPEKAFRAFVIYSDIPPLERTYIAAFRLYKDEATGQPEGTCQDVNVQPYFRGWTERYDWRERALAKDDAKARARVEGELRGITSRWTTIAAEKEKQFKRILDLGEAAYQKAQDIFNRELSAENYSMAHAVQMSKFSLEVYKMLLEQERLSQAHNEGRWTDADEDAVADALEELSPEGAIEFFEEAQRRTEDENHSDPL
jgi:hypothetical protein